MWCRQRVDAALVGPDGRSASNWDAGALQSFLCELHDVCREGTFYMSVERNEPPEDMSALDTDRGDGSDGVYWHKMYFESCAVEALAELRKPGAAERLIATAAAGGSFERPDLHGRVRPPWSAAAAGAREDARAAEAMRVGLRRSPAVLLAGYLGEVLTVRCPAPASPPPPLVSRRAAWRSPLSGSCRCSLADSALSAPWGARTGRFTAHA